MRQGVQHFCATDRLNRVVAEIQHGRAHHWTPPRETYSWTWADGVEKSFQECSRDELLEVATTLAQEMRQRSEVSQLLR